METEPLWEVVEEHLDEAELAVRLWLRSVESPALTLDGLWRKVEQRLLAHVDGLTVPGMRAATALLVPALDSHSRLQRKAAALLALLRMHGIEHVLDALRSDDAGLRAAAEWVLETGGSPAVSDRIAEEMRSVSAPRMRTSLLKAAAARALPIPIALMLTSLNSDDPLELAVAAKAARFQDREALKIDLVRLLDHAAPSVREAALITLLGFDVPQALPRCRFLAADADRPDPGAWLLLALVGDPGDVEVLLTHLRHPASCARVLFALGYSGSFRAVEHILAYVEDDDPTIARLAGEAFSMIVGFDANAGGATLTPPPINLSLPLLEEDDAAASLVPSPEDELPLLRGSVVREFWSAKHEIDRSKRLLMGKPWDLPAIFEFLARAPMRSRHAIGLWLGIRSNWRYRLNTRTFSHIQREQMRTIVANPLAALPRRPANRASSARREGSDGLDRG